MVEEVLTSFKVELEEGKQVREELGRPQEDNDRPCLRAFCVLTLHTERPAPQSSSAWGVHLIAPQHPASESGS